MAARLDPPLSDRLREAAFDGFTDALAVSFWVCAATAVVGAVVAAALLGRPRRDTPAESETTAAR
ncbi:hypothetical protein [Streptomyces cupreus]|uniref:Uncharacterized protein n=1 Tax=Streptomyces cupreus TaxID=2759956 RepID=A0A7X1MFD5_9ACTN|nr:hypothetical protein [Streptomyces cupreus]MBC2906610.1 hypothetical protein [Streptomyces cupreus]